MAVSKLKSLPVFRQPKFPVYEAMYKLNLAFESLALEIEHLDDYEAIPLETLQFYRATAEELRAGINHRLTLILHTREEKEAYQWEQRLDAIKRKWKKRSE